MAEHREVRHHPHNGHIAIRLDQTPFTDAQQAWLHVYLDERGDVVAKGLTDADVADWPPLTPDKP